VHVVDAGADYVVLACPTEVACQHAMFSVAANARTKLDAWRSGWQPGYGYRYSLRVDEPRDEPYDD
jgi:hypothetical protein